VARVRQDLPAETALIGFCGAPWTVATYMVGGKGSPDQAAARGWAYRDRTGFAHLIDLVVDTSIDYLDGQVRAGADAVQIFDSWAGSLPDDEFETWVVAPTRRIVTELRQRHPATPIIGFPRGMGTNAEHYVEATGVDGLGCDTAVPLQAMRALATRGVAVQGNLDPLLLVAGGEAMRARVGATLAAMQGLPYIFNLGHGIVPQTPPEHVAELVALVRGSASGG
jgi:uroporphyrinogen decarboxylase